MLPKLDLCLALSEDKMMFSGYLSEWEIILTRQKLKQWVVKISFMSPFDQKITQYSSDKPYKRHTALNYIRTFAPQAWDLTPLSGRLHQIVIH